MSIKTGASPDSEVTRQELVQRARDLARPHGERLTLRSVCEAAGISRERIVKLCGSWSELRREIGLTPHGLHSRKTLTDEAMREKLRSAVAEHGENVTQAKFSEMTGYSSTLILRRFGSWAKLRQSLGLSARAKMACHYSDGEIFDDIFQVTCRISRKPTFRAYPRNGGKISPQTMCDRFGSWDKVIFAFEDEMDRRRGDTQLRYRQDPRNKNAFFVFRQGKPLHYIEYEDGRFENGKVTPLPKGFEM